MATTAKSVILRDKDDGKQLLPMTRAELVIRNDGTSVEASLAGKQDTLVSGENLKTVNNQSLLGSGNLTITGEPGDDGVGISSVVQTTESTESGGTNVITVTMSDGSTSTFNVRNGDAVGSATIVQTTGDSTTSVMSQDGTTKALADNKSHVLKVSPNSVFTSANTIGELTSKRNFVFSDIQNATVVIRNVSYLANGTVNYFNLSSVLGFYVSDNTFLRCYIDGYNIKLQLKVNNTFTQNVTWGTINGTLPINNYGDCAISFDAIAKVFRLYSYNTSSSVITLLDEYDISSWNLSSLTDVYLMTSVSMFTAHAIGAALAVNTPLLLGSYIAAPVQLGFYNVPQGTSYIEDLYLAGTGLTVGGTVTQTISDTDKIVSISNSSAAYFALGPTNMDDAYGWYHIKMRFSSVGEGAYFSLGASNPKNIVVESQGLPVALITTSNDKFYPETNTDYDFYFQFGAMQSQSYYRNYGVRAYGDMTVEISEPYMFNAQVQNICAETYNGDEFSGAIPFYGDVSFFDYEYTGTGAPGNLRIPFGTLRTYLGYIYMWNGTVWKMISNV